MAISGFMARRLVTPLLAKPQQSRRDQLSALLPPPSSVVLFGDSITEGGEWQELLPALPVVNRGVSGETASQLLSRVASGLNQPSAVVLLIGTNDLSLGLSCSNIANTVRRILDEIEGACPGTPVLLQSVMPRSSKFASEILDLNARYRRLAETRPHVDFVDLWPLLSEGPSIRPTYSFDSLHLNGAGYRAWVSALGPALERFSTGRSSTTRH
ncbi:GDSL-type esterase/lipase family protein [uncultured Microbacterium sp.]|uniref:GDSL-type esterase/lipase family protein n=1 Tax=uncultured Microbacterium sp. TaxID=191216 RepID=UPI0028D6E7BE|nr:GDSL-type esterase/lipase family protein [uncultured Microbacterium sp.]